MFCDSGDISDVSKLTELRKVLFDSKFESSNLSWERFCNEIFEFLIGVGHKTEKFPKE